MFYWPPPLGGAPVGSSRRGPCGSVYGWVARKTVQFTVNWCIAQGVWSTRPTARLSGSNLNGPIINCGKKSFVSTESVSVRRMGVLLFYLELKNVVCQFTFFDAGCIDDKNPSGISLAGVCVRSVYASLQAVTYAIYGRPPTQV